MKGIHLLNQSQNGVDIQFYLLLTTVISMLKFKQSNQENEDLEEKVEEKREKKG